MLTLTADAIVLKAVIFHNKYFLLSSVFVFSKSVDDASELKVGDVITYNGEVGTVKGKSITHKIIEIRDENGKLIFVTQGVANPVADPPITSMLHGSPHSESA